MAQYYEVLSQGDKSSDQQFYSNVEDQTVQYVITPDKTQVQYPTQQIVVTSAEQLMGVDGQPQQIVIDHTQGSVTYSGQQLQQTQVHQIQVPQQIVQQQVIQQQVGSQHLVQQQVASQRVQIQTQQFAVIPDVSLNNGTQQIFFMESNNSNDTVVSQAQSVQQPIVLNHQLSQSNSIVRSSTPSKGTNHLQQMQQQARGQLRQPNVQQTKVQPRAGLRTPNSTNQPVRQMTPVPLRPPNPNSFPLKHPCPSSSLTRSPNPNQNVMRQATPSQSQIRQSTPTQRPQLRDPGGSQQQSTLRTPNPLPRLNTPGQQQLRPPTPNPGLPRQPNPNQPARQPTPGQLRAPNQVGQHRAPSQLGKSPGTVSARFQGPSQMLPQKINMQGMEFSDLEINSSDEQEAISLSDGTVVSVAAYKKMLTSQKTSTTQQNSTPNQTGVPISQSTTGRKKNSARTTRQPVKSGARGARGRSMLQFQASPRPEHSPPRAANDPAQYAMMNQQQQKMSKLPPLPQPVPNQLQHQTQQNQQHTQQNQPQTQQNQQQMQQNQLHTQQSIRQQNQLIQQQQQQQQNQNQMRPSQANYVIQPPKQNQKPQQQRPLPAYIPSSQIQKIIESTPIAEEFSDSIRMLVLLENGEQRLITFTLPKEACTIQEILEQVNVPFQSHTNIQVTEANSNGINYIVTVGNVTPLGYEEEESQLQEEPTTLSPTPPTTAFTSSQTQPPLPPPPAPIQQHEQSPLPPCPPLAPQPILEPASPPSPEPSKDHKFIPGMLALCGACGYLSEDFLKCIRCYRKLPDGVKAIPAAIKAANGQKRDFKTIQQTQQLQQQQASHVHHQQTSHVQHQQASQVHQQTSQIQQQASQVQQQASQVQQQASQVQQQTSQVQQQQAMQAQQPLASQVQPHQAQPNPSKPNPSSSKQSSPKKKSLKSSKAIETESVHVISSDEEEDQKPKLSENILQKLGSSVTICPITKEPSSNDIQRHCSVKSKTSSADSEDTTLVTTTLRCRTVRIGSYRCIPTEKVLIDSMEVIIKVPHPAKEKEIRTLKIDSSEIVKVLASFNPALPVVFYYLTPGQAKLIRQELDMVIDGDYYYDPLSMEDDTYRRITLLPDDMLEEDKHMFQLIYGSAPSILDELNVKEANDILIKTCPKELTRSSLGLGTFTEIKQILTYPPEGRGRISINTEDYVCLGLDQFLNDVIIDFYLKFLVEQLQCDQKAKVHVFSTFFYKRLTTKPVKASRKCQPSEIDPLLTPAQKRHARVKTWTKNVNLFEKDFVIVPINENAHWFLAIICFPGMDGCQTWDGKPYKLEINSKKKKKGSVTTIGSVSVASVKLEKGTKTTVCDDPDASDKDEAEGDESELESDGSEELPLSQNSDKSSTSSAPATPTPKIPKEARPPIKQPCILIFDSLAGASRCRVVATLRDYLTCEYKARLGKEKTFNKDVIKGASPKVPQQNNFTDCGLYVLQYVEQFFKDPIHDYHIPIKEIQNWFEEIVVTRKREELANLIKRLMREYGQDLRILPEIIFPTFNGKIVERDFEDEEEEDEMMDEEEALEEEEMEQELNDTNTTFGSSKSESFTEGVSSADETKPDGTSSPIKPSSENLSDDFVTQAVLNPKPDLSEFPRQTNKDTLSYLKAKRIIRHKNSDGPEVKKLRGHEQN